MTEDAADGSSDDLSTLDRELESWQQGDVARDGLTLSAASRALPLTDAARKQAAADDEPGLLLIGEAHDEVVVLTQTCDIVRSVQDDPAGRSAGRPWVQVAPVVRIPEEELALARRTARWAPIPGLGADAFADLDQCTTLEKAVLVQMERVRGCRNDNELRAFGQACGRYRSRFAFPNLVVRSMSGLRSRVLDKTTKNSPEGRCVDAVLEIRAEADREWSQPGVNVVLHFIVKASHLGHVDLDEDADAGAPAIPPEANEGAVATLIEKEGPEPASHAHARWQRLAELWTARCSTNDHVASVAAMVHSEDEFPLALQRRTDRLDLEFLSGPDEVSD